MKSPLYLLTILLPLATEIVIASPADFDDSDTLEERDRGGGGKFGDKSNACRIQHPYWYWKYPCDSSDKFGRENTGGQWNAICRYNNWYKTKKGWVHDFDKPNNCRMFSSSTLRQTLSNKK
ncbi:hypothetical protein N7513_013210 [Penicillium frequentans]|nr:hypothetical protein N7513_013210 [Penicillium glabrum]